MSYRRAHEHIVEDYMLQLKQAPFDTKDAKLGGKAGPCTTCPKRTGNQKELFPDISSADVCTDPTCFAMKKNAFIQRTLATAKEAGEKVLSLDECKKIFPYEHDTTPANKYVSLEDTCYDDLKCRKYSQLIKGIKDAEIVYAVHPHKMKLIELMEKSEAARIIKKLGIKARGSASDSKWRHDQAKARKEERIRKATLNRLVEIVSKKAQADKAHSFLRILAESILGSSHFDGQRAFAQRRDKSIKGGMVYDAIKKHLKSLQDRELLAFCLELRMISGGIFNPYNSTYGETAASLCKHYKIDIKKIHASVKKELEAKRRGKNKTSKK